MTRSALFIATASAALISTPVLAGATPWPTFVNETSTRMVMTPGLSLNDTQEKDYSWGDLDHDGDIDLVVARKNPFTTPGGRANVLFMNENGVLVDRTSVLAIDSDVAGDQGFLALDNDREITMVDVNGDTWLDVVTAPTLSEGQPVHISHPRVYINKGVVRGVWQGLKYESARMPTFPMLPNFCGTGVGDISGDGKPDLYFADYSSFVGMPDLNDRLLINNGNGFFADQTAIRMPANMTASGFGVQAIIVDVNGDGFMDVVKDSALGEVPTQVTVAYQNPSTPGFFFPASNYQTVAGGSTYFVSAGDLNNDGRMDLLITDDGTDHFHLNQGNGPNGHATWSNGSLPASGDIGGDTQIVDLNNDGFKDIILTGEDVDFSGCFRPGNIYRNSGTVPSVTFTVELGGIPASNMSAVHDAAPFDINGDGWTDIVLGRCTGHEVWISHPPCAGTDLNCDGDTNGVDLGILLSQWNTDGSADFNNDNIVNGVDLGIMLAAWTL